MSSALSPYPLTPSIRRSLEALEPLGFNYDAGREGPDAVPEGWRVESFRVDLPAESPGPPQAVGVFAAARRVLASMRFVDPAVLRVWFDPGTPLLNRTLLLRVRAAGLVTVDFGARIVRVVDTVDDLHEAWGFAYRTLATHFEQGEISFIVHKDLKEGAVWVTIERYSRLGRIRNPFYRIGAAFLARPMQIRYARYVLRRIPELVEEERRTRSEE